jgi:Kdo2-lipid IVA lauroyltransferase/acyltransferase
MQLQNCQYSFRLNPWSLEAGYQQDSEALFCKRGRQERRIQYSTIREVQVYKVRYLGSRASYWRCVLRYGRGHGVCLQAAHVLGFGRIEDRTAIYIPFIKKLEAHIAAANPGVVFREGRQWLAYWDAAVGAMFVLVQRSTRLISFNHAARASSWLMRRIGRWLKGHRIARANLVAAYPEKSAQEIDRILLGMWDNIGRLFVEYACLDRLWDFDSKAEPGRIFLDENSLRRFRQLCEAKRPVLLFGAHLANWELLAWAVGCRNGEAAIVYRPPKVASVERELAKMRAHSKVAYIPANADAIFKMKQALTRGAVVGMLVDEHFARGVDVNFFGRPCTAAPILARLARHFNCPMHGGRMVRLPDGRFRFDITEPIPVQRDREGKIDVAAATQAITGVIEGWVRDHPEQWLWLQRRWR